MREKKSSNMSDTPAAPVRRILVVDDEYSVRMALKLLLRFDGHAVDLAANAEEALAAFAPDTYDLVITDYCMPGMNGAELAQLLKARERIPIILLTAFPPQPLPSVIDLLLTKPFLLETLRDALSRVLSLELTRD
ncbi:MAG TPA: response regulator [Verrucomicrobiae bacterium]|nr:response regulator [Verrucomicrobiae bacterium]